MTAGGAFVIARAISIVLLAASLLLGCTSTITSSPAASASASPSPAGIVPTTTPSVLPTPTALPTTTAATATTALNPSVISACVRNGTDALAGVAELRPEGWSDQTPDGAALTDFANTVGRVYGPEAIDGPPYEGPGRLVVYGTFPASDAYFKSRIAQSREHGGKPVPVSVCGEKTEVWLDEVSGELVLGWTDRDKSDVLVGNTADFTIQQLVEIAERVADCCG